MDQPRVVELPAYRVVKLHYEGPPPPAASFFEHWDRFNEWAELRAKSAVEDVWAIGYAPPARVGSDVLVYDACVPVARDFEPEGLAGLELGEVPGGRYVLCAGETRELPLLFRAAKRYAMSHGLAIERGFLELYRPHPEDSDVHPVDAGYRIHD